ncbi:MAG TPA: choice-of-anchor L domain-containing protein [Casimicrobiaceae bacterium]|nr:choice-of-anchor L domain-containing protein [Casimicrobiaceae bacterium]
MDFRRGLRAGAGLFVGIAALLGAACTWASPIVVKPLSANSGSPAAVQMLVSSLLGGGITVVPGSVQYTGATAASGLFINGGTDLNTTVGINYGVVLTTGDARFVSGSAISPDDFPNKTTAFGAGILNTLTRNTSPGSSLFSSLTSAQTFNASILSFQFIPTGSSITLKYVFGSEEYGDVVNTGFPPDVLGIFVNGVNYARVPGTSVPVSTVSINCGGPTSGAASGVNPQNCSLYRDNPPFFGKIETELDGLTVVLTLTAPVLANQVNTIQFGIANSSDSYADSAVFIQAGSLQSAP